MAKMIPIQPAIRLVLKDDWALIASEAGRYAHGLRPTVGLWNNGTMCEAESFSLADGKIRQAFAALVANRIRGYAQMEVEHKLLELFTAVEGRLRDRPAHGPAPEAQEPALPWSDYTNALAFVRDHGPLLRYCHVWGSWLVWTGTHWTRDTSGAVMRYAKATMKRLARQVEHLGDAEAYELLKHIKTSLATTKLRALIECAESEPGIPVQPEALDAAPWLLNCSNGSLELRTGTLRPHRQDDLLTKCLPLDYDPEATCPVWDSFLWRVMGGTTREGDTPDMSAGTLENRQAADERAVRLIAFLQRAIGYALTGITTEQCLFILHGSGANGKSTFLEALQTLLGEYAQSTPSASLLAKDRQDGIPNDIARLRGARFVSAVEIGDGRRLNEELVKRLTGQDTLTARFLFAEFFDFQAQFKLWLACNHLPQIRGTDHAIWRRIKLIPFLVTIPDAEQDKDLPARLRAELPGILAWAVRGGLVWQREGLGTPPEVVTATTNYRQTMDVFEGFLSDACYRLPGAQATAGALYSAYEGWCKANDVEPLTRRLFGMRLADCGFTPDKGTGGTRIWRGIGLPAPAEDARRSGG